MLKVNNIYKAYKDKQVLKGVSFNVLDNEVKAIIGVNGAGKSTLIEIICNVKKSDSGEVFLNNYNIFDKKNSLNIKKMFGYMPQTFCMFNDLTVKENLGYVASVYGLDKNVVDEIIKGCGLEDHSKTLAKNLSGGYRQLLSMATALIHSPEIIILDEPTSAMDPIFRQKFWQIIHNYRKQNKMVLLITHYLEELMQCDSFACLSDGKICFDGKVEDFKEENLLNIEKVLEKCIQKSKKKRKDDGN